MQVQQPLFTVATITYNSAKWVKQAIESVLASSFTDFELLISDDCSTDNTWEIIQQYNDLRINAWRNEKNIGEYPNRNKVLNAAKGKFILYLDGDDILYKDALSDYSRYLEAFPEAKGVWGVYNIDFIAFPYLLTPYQLSCLNFLTTYPITVVGFTDSVFSVHELKTLGGFHEKYSIGDTYIKRKYCCFNNVILVQAGRAFWRQHPGQASNKVNKKYINLIESYLIDKEILSANYFPLKGVYFKQAKMNFRISIAKRIVSNTLQKGKVLSFIRIMRKLSIPISELFLIFRKGEYNYNIGGNAAEPLLNNYNLK